MTAILDLKSILSGQIWESATESSALQSVVVSSVFGTASDAVALFRSDSTTFQFDSDREPRKIYETGHQNISQTLSKILLAGDGIDAYEEVDEFSVVVEEWAGGSIS